ncbi:MAG: hypothetical protein JW864_04395 [Spirochaetes bacterium]|nr:hypothetical protein [Spirochaetota bacterium]
MRSIFSLFLLLSVALLFTACGGGSGMGGQVEGESFVTEGWVSPDIFRVTSTGVPKPGLKNKVQRRGTAKEAALIMAQKRVIEKFVGARLEGAAGAADYASTGIAVSKEFGGLVKGGTIVKSTYDDDDNCEIVYQVEKKNLRKEVEGGAEVTQ